MLRLLLLILINLSYILSLTAICFGELKLLLPVRYLHIQLVENGTNLTTSKGPIQYKLDIDSSFYSANIVDRGDGSYIFRLILARTVPKIRLSISIDNYSLCESPLLIIGYDNQQMLNEKCDSPIELERWLELAKCPIEEQIEKDLSPFPLIDFDKVLEKAVSTWGKPEHSRTYAICHYQIINNRAYRKCYGEYSDFRFLLDKTLASLLRKIYIPNTEFLFNLGDYPLSSPNDDLPMVSWCGSLSTLDIVLPTYIYSAQITDYTFSDINMHFSGPIIPWEKKFNKAIFRGRDSNLLRLELAKLSQRESEGLIDAGITAFFFHPEDPPRKERMPFTEFFQYKYIISVDGTVAAYRFPSLLAGSSIVLKADSQFYEHFYSKMIPYVHYIPFDQHNIKAVLEWISNVDLNETLRNQKQFVLDHLQPKNFYCYLANFFKVFPRDANMIFQVYTNRLKNPPKEVKMDLEEADGVFLKCNVNSDKYEL